ncbi:DUF4245 domain-containing protein [Modestobacter marinus]|uniref:DUF4245 domain-containing protein n=1 Tax=Modestobacter marinus TaxID=477641 RepID=UPI001C9612EF|nr:DUF4245 domain-containing protein [Modestobacter marinus]
MPHPGQSGQRPDEQIPPGAATTVTQQAPPPPPAVDRMGRFTPANMLRSLLPLVLICLFIVGVMALRQNPEDPVREVDTTSAERASAELASYELLVPRGLPEGWRPTSVRTNAGSASTGDPITLQIGWYTPGGEYAEYVVSDDPAAEALTDVLEDATLEGEEQVDGETWQRITTEREETALTRDEGTATLAVTGSASDEELGTLAGSLEPYTP